MKKININGVDYIRKEELDKLRSEMNKNYIKRSELNKIKSSIIDLGRLVGIAPICNEEGMLKIPKQKVEEKPKRKDYRKTFTPRSKDNRLFTPAPSSRIDLDIKGTDENGHFIKKNGYKTAFTVKDVRFLREKVNPRTTFADIRQYARLLQMRPEDARVIVYNIRNGVFEKYI